MINIKVLLETRDSLKIKKNAIFIVFFNKILYNGVHKKFKVHRFIWTKLFVN